MFKNIFLLIFFFVCPTINTQRILRIALAQMEMGCISEDNFQKSLCLMEQASARGADVICFPELQFHRFFPQYPDGDQKACAITINDPWIKGIQEKCKSLGIIAVPNVYFLEQGQYYDASLIIDITGEIVGVSKMVRIPHGKFFYEQSYFAPSETGFKTYNTSRAKIGVVVCFDRHFPESIRACALQGAELVIIPTANLKDEPMEVFEWEMRIAAFQNNLFVAMCNRVGIEDQMHFSGESLVCGPFGTTLQKAGDSEGLVMAEINLSEASRANTVKPFLSFL